MKRIYHDCPQCGTSIFGRRIYCSEACYDKARRGRSSWNKGQIGLPANRPRNGEDRSCQLCGTMFYSSKHTIETRDPKFCSMKCYLQSRWCADDLKCIVCGTDSVTRFCSAECRHGFWKRNQYNLLARSRYWKRKLALITELGGVCVVCGIADFRVLDIHHKDPSAKVTPQGRVWTWTRRFKDWAANKGNLELLCANCHRLRTWEDSGYGPNRGNEG